MNPIDLPIFVDNYLKLTKLTFLCGDIPHPERLYSAEILVFQSVNYNALVSQVIKDIQGSISKYKSNTMYISKCS